jgi:protoheme IX farnesyltransferase
MTTRIGMTAETHANSIPSDSEGAMIDDAVRPMSTGLTGIRAVISDYVALMKPGIMTLLLVTTLGAMLVAEKAVPDFGLILVTLLGGVLTAGGANVLNCYIDRDIDAVMSRTKKRGTANGRISPLAALVFGISLTVAGTLLLGFVVNWLAAALALAGNLYYVFVYTLWLKRRTPHNIVVGGAAGAVPPLVGWVAVTGTLAAPAWILFAIIFYWTPPHFWALSLLKQGEYGRVGVPMLPVVAGEEETRKQVFLYTILLAAVTLLLVPFGMSWIYFAGAVALGGYFLWLAWKLLRDPSKARARTTFFYSIWYLAALFAVMVTDRLVFA